MGNAQNHLQFRAFIYAESVVVDAPSETSQTRNYPQLAGKLAPMQRGFSLSLICKRQVAYGAQ
jgi:hypothetical protein